MAAPRAARPARFSAIRKPSKRGSKDGAGAPVQLRHPGVRLGRALGPYVYHSAPAPCFAQQQAQRWLRVLNYAGDLHLAHIQYRVAHPLILAISHTPAYAKGAGVTSAANQMAPPARTDGRSAWGPARLRTPTAGGPT